jgi:hypothetical protein
MNEPAMKDSPEKPILGGSGVILRKQPFRASLVQRSQAHSLYLIERLPWKDISERTGLPVRYLQNLAHREKWTAVKARTAKKVEARSLARINEHVEEIVEAVATATESLSLRTLTAAGEVLDAKKGDFWAKDVQSLSQAAKNFVGLARQARGLASDVEKSSAAPAMIFVQLERIGPRAPKQAQPIEVEAKAV